MQGTAYYRYSWDIESEGVSRNRLSRHEGGASDRLRGKRSRLDKVILLETDVQIRELFVIAKNVY